MANVTYYIGAGASAGRRHTNGAIIEGLPCVKEIPNRLQLLILQFRAQIPNFRGSDKSELEALVASFEELYEASRRHSTIDTYAKKLFLRGETEAFGRLEAFLAFYFIVEQILLKPDNRYDTFLANVLDQNLEIPHNIHVISWNYDSQFEIAYKEYSKEKELPVASKNHWVPDKAYKIIKVNGTASFENIRDIRALREEYPRLTNMARGEDYIDATRTRYILDLYKKFKTEAGATQLSFAFDGRQEKSLYNAVDRIIEYTDVLVVIGYTFPFFNREIDRRLLRRFGSASTIYIQDIYPERIKQSIKAVLPRFPESHIVPLTDVEQFFLPPEL